MFNIGMLHFERGEWKDAQGNFQEVLRKYPNSPRAFTAQTLFEQAGIYLRDPSKAPAAVEAPEPDDVAAQYIRVLVIDYATEVLVTASTPIMVRERRPGGSEFTAGNSVRILTASKHFSANGRTLAGGDISLSCADQSLEVSDRAFRGELIFHSRDTGFFVVNRLLLEDYLRGVIPREMPASWPIEALKAQAVAARTYALYQIEKHRDEQWDVMATVMSQVYGGRGAETTTTDQAVRETTGQILTYNERPILAYFHSNSGGSTESTDKVWGTQLPYLEAVEDPYSLGTRVDAWEAVFTLDKINAALANDGLTGITDVVPVEFSPSGRVTRIRFKTSNGSAEMPANTTRLRLGSTVMKSTWWEANKQGSRLHFQGRGYGHGVGMSQWGAKAMAALGFDFLQILHHYYPRCSVLGVN